MQKKKMTLLDYKNIAVKIAELEKQGDEAAINEYFLQVLSEYSPTLIELSIIDEVVQEILEHPPKEDET